MAKIKYHYDEALNSNPNKNNEIYLSIINEYPELGEHDIVEKYNRYHVDVLRHFFY